MYKLKTFKEYQILTEYHTAHTKLLLAHSNLTDLYGIEEYTNLEYLDLDFNNIEDITPLAGLKNLKLIMLSNNKISDISPLSGLIKLKKLDLSHNLIKDITPLKNLHIQKLWIGENDISNIDVLLTLDKLDIINMRFINMKNKSINNKLNSNESGILMGIEILELKNIIKYERRKRIISEL